jgi:SWI/SNF chromatin-remodeling complex subunit SWI1
LPMAVDTLAKLLACDEPNRHFFKSLFSSDLQSSASESTGMPTGAEGYTLLTRAFALAISIIPDRTRRDVDARRVAELRKPTLIHGMLAADILASLCPGPESGVARAWLESEDAWGGSLLRLCSILCNVPPGVRANVDHEETGFALVTRHALIMLKSLVEKSTKHRRHRSSLSHKAKLDSKAIKQERTKIDSTLQDNGKADEKTLSEDEDKSWLALMADIIPATEIIVGALGTPTIDRVALKHLVALASIEA